MAQHQPTKHLTPQPSNTYFEVRFCTINHAGHPRHPDEADTNYGTRAPQRGKSIDRCCYGAGEIHSEWVQNAITNADVFFTMIQIIQRALRRAGCRIDMMVAQEVRHLLSTPHPGTTSTNDADPLAEHWHEAELSSSTALSNAEGG